MQPQTPPEIKLFKKIRNTIVLFVVCLVISGVTAFPIETELRILTRFFTTDFIIGQWLHKILEGVVYVNNHYPFMAYGTDWLAFAHIVIAIAFIGPLIDPVKNIWVIQFGMISCLLVFPLAFIAGSVRGIPLFWQLIDCSFGIVGIIPLLFCYKWIGLLEQLRKNHTSSIKI